MFQAVCGQDLERVVANLASAPCGTEPPSWIKIGNPAYSQAIGRHELFGRSIAVKLNRADAERLRDFT